MVLFDMVLHFWWFWLRGAFYILSGFICHLVCWSSRCNVFLSLFRAPISTHSDLSIFRYQVLILWNLNQPIRKKHVGEHCELPIPLAFFLTASPMFFLSFRLQFPSSWKLLPMVNGWSRFYNVEDGRASVHCFSMVLKKVLMSETIRMSCGHLWNLYSDWWFGTFSTFPYLGKNNPNWLSYFSEG